MLPKKYIINTNFQYGIDGVYSLTIIYVNYKYQKYMAELKVQFTNSNIFTF